MHSLQIFIIYNSGLWLLPLFRRVFAAQSDYLSMPSICMCPRIVFVVQVLDEICPLIAIATFGCAGVAQRGVGGSEHLLGNEGNLQASKLQSWYTYINPNFNFQILQYLGLLLTRSNYQ